VGESNALQLLQWLTDDGAMAEENRPRVIRPRSRMSDKSRFPGDIVQEQRFEIGWLAFSVDLY